MDGPLVVRLVWLRAVVERAVLVGRVDAGPPVLPLMAELLMILHPWPVRRVAPQADAEPQGGQPRQALRTMLRLHLPSPDGGVVWRPPDCLPNLLQVPLVQLVWFAV